MDPAELVQVLKYQRLFVDYAFVSGCAVFIYDYLLTLHLEIELIWFSKWTYTKVLFLLVRYTTAALVFFVLFDQLSPNLSIGTCKATFPISVSLLVTSVSLADVILAVRTWTVWHRNMIVGIGLAILVLLDVVVRYPMMYMFLKSLDYAPAPYPGSKGCAIGNGMKILWVNYALMMVLQSGALALMAVSGFRSYRRGDSSELWNVIHKDGIMFYVYILGFTALNLTFGLSLPLYISMMFNPMQAFIYSVLTARIVLTIRSMGNMPELHTGYEPTVPSVPLQFFVPYEGSREEQSIDLMPEEDPKPWSQ